MEKTIVTKDSFRDWKANPVTKAVMNDIHNRIVRLQDELGNSAGLDPLQDRWKVGVITGYNDLLNVEYGEVSDGN